MLALLGELTRSEVDREVRIGSHERNALVSNLALKRRIEVIGENLCKRMGVDTTTGHVLRTRIVAALNNENSFACFGEGVSRHAACATTTDNNDVEIRFEIGIQSNLGHFFPFKG